ncbi:MAG: hypothetical protein IJM30_13335 [Thermoguttaceae bacterium]|nr:hypothetical protein [Thermoguttaceae bacterium]
MSTTPSSSDSELDPLFSDANDFASEFSETNVPDLDVAASSSVTASNPFAEIDEVSNSEPFRFSEPVGVVSDASASSELSLSKSSKRSKPAKPAKAPKPKKEKPAKSSSAKVESEADNAADPNKGARRSIYLLAFLLFVGVVGANVAALASKGGDALMYLIVFDVLGIVLLSIPFMWASQTKKGRVPSLFDALVALAAIFVTICAMILLTYEAKEYNLSTKVSATSVVQEDFLRC